MSVPAVQSPLSAGVTMEFLRRKAPELAKDIVAQIDGARSLATTHYGLSDEQWEALRNSRHFQDLVRQAHEELAGPLGLNERIRRMARYGLAEQGMADLFGMIGDPKHGMMHRVRGLELAAEIAGVNAKSMGSGSAAVSHGPLVHIQFSGGREVTVGVNPPIEGESKKIEE